MARIEENNYDNRKDFISNSYFTKEFLAIEAIITLVNEMLSEDGIYCELDDIFESWDEGYDEIAEYIYYCEFPVLRNGKILMHLYFSNDDGYHAIIQNKTTYRFNLPLKNSAEFALDIAQYVMQLP